LRGHPEDLTTGIERLFGIDPAFPEGRPPDGFFSNGWLQVGYVVRWVRTELLAIQAFEESKMIISANPGCSMDGGTKRPPRWVNFTGIMFLLMTAGVSEARQSTSPETTTPKRAVRVCATQPPSRLINWELSPAEALTEVDEALAQLEQLAESAAGSGCDALAFPEDALGLFHWEMGNKASIGQVLPQAVDRMLKRLGNSARAHSMYIVTCNDNLDENGAFRNTAFLIGRDGREIGRYHKVHPALQEMDRVRGEGFPVFETPDMGRVGMLICYDMVMPESTRSLALEGAGLVFLSTLGGAIMAGDPDVSGDDLDRAAFRTRAADNFIYLVVSRRGGGAKIISPQGTILAEAPPEQQLIFADIDPFAGRDGGDALNVHHDMRSRLFRERNPSAYKVLTDPHPPILDLVPESLPAQEAVRRAERLLTVGEKAYQQAEDLRRQGRLMEARQAFEALQADFTGTWIERAARQRLAEIHENNQPAAP